MTADIRAIADRLHEAACTPGCPYPATSPTWMEWAEKIAAGHVTHDEAVAHINPDRAATQ